MKAKVSIIIPCYNALPFIKETLDSLLRQTYKNIEVIIIDDGSTDGTLDFLKTVTEINLTVKGNLGKGACAARNYGFRLSTGDYIQFLDADDLLSANKIQEQVEALNNDLRGIAVCSTKHFYNSIDNGKIVDKDFLYTTDNPRVFLLNLYGADGKTHQMVQTSAWLTPKSLIKKAGPWDESLSKDQDGEFFCRVVSRADKVIYTPDALNYYRKHVKGANIANQKQRKHLQSQLEALFSKSQQFKGLEETAAYKNAMALQYKLIAINAFPEFKVLSQKALKQSNQYGGSNFLPVLGGKIIEFIKHTLGWRTAKSFSHTIHNFILK